MQPCQPCGPLYDRTGPHVPEDRSGAAPTHTSVTGEDLTYARASSSTDHSTVLVSARQQMLRGALLGLRAARAPRCGLAATDELQLISKLVSCVLGALRYTSARDCARAASKRAGSNATVSALCVWTRRTTKRCHKVSDVLRARWPANLCGGGAQRVRSNHDRETPGAAASLSAALPLGMLP